MKRLKVFLMNSQYLNICILGVLILCADLYAGNVFFERLFLIGFFTVVSIAATFLIRKFVDRRETGGFENFHVEGDISLVVVNLSGWREVELSASEPRLSKIVLLQSCEPILLVTLAATHHGEHLEVVRSYTELLAVHAKLTSDFPPGSRQGSRIPSLPELPDVCAMSGKLLLIYI